MNISSNCLDLIKKFEGLELDAYLDPVGVPTIGYGTIRYPDGRKVKPPSSKRRHFCNQNAPKSPPM
jgi:GH24 family phage-related lysozyme (muramidase)